MSDKPTADAGDSVSRVSLPDGSGGVLCTNCGLCCSGALHDRASLRPDEVEWAAAIGLEVTLEEGPSFRLPCPKLVDRKCSIFHQRPKVCPAYRCRLLDDVDRGTVKLSDAFELVATARHYLNEATDALTVPTLAQARFRARHLPMDKLAPDKGTPTSAELTERLLVTRLDVFLDRHFRGDGDMTMYKAAEADGSVEMNVQEAGRGEC